MATLRICSLFSGIGGFEVGLAQNGLQTLTTCENDELARAVLKSRFPSIRHRLDVTAMQSLPACDLLTAGWPCQDLSQAGSMAGINGAQSGLIEHVFRLLDASKRKPPLLLLENVAFALHLHRGAAIRNVISKLEARGYRWAYRILNTIEFGLPQRRRRIFIIAAQDFDPVRILFDGMSAKFRKTARPNQVGFYWTEGNRGIGWSPDSVPPLKGGSGLSIPSSPAIWDRSNRRFFVPTIDDAERLQGFRKGWTTAAAELANSNRVRWRLVGNAVSVPVIRWIGKRIKLASEGSLREAELPTNHNIGRHNLAWGGPNQPPRMTYLDHEGPAKSKRVLLSDFRLNTDQPLSLRAATGFYERLRKSPLIVEPDFMRDLKEYCDELASAPNKAA